MIKNHTIYFNPIYKKTKKRILISTVLEELYELKGFNCWIKNNLMESFLKGKKDASGGSC